jgi:hypothetical protein
LQQINLKNKLKFYTALILFIHSNFTNVCLDIFCYLTMTLGNTCVSGFGMCQYMSETPNNVENMHASHFNKIKCAARWINMHNIEYQNFGSWWLIQRQRLKISDNKSYLWDSTLDYYKYLIEDFDDPFLNVSIIEQWTVNKNIKPIIITV